MPLSRFVPVYCNLTIHYQRKGVLGEDRGGVFFLLENKGEGAQQTLRAEWGGEVEMQGQISNKWKEKLSNSSVVETGGLLFGK